MGDTKRNPKIICTEVDDGIKHWYEVDLLSLPGASGYEEDMEPSIFTVDLLGSEYESPDNRNWYEIDLYSEPVSAADEAEETSSDDVGTDEDIDEPVEREFAEEETTGEEPQLEEEEDQSEEELMEEETEPGVE